MIINIINNSLLPKKKNHNLFFLNENLFVSYNKYYIKKREMNAIIKIINISLIKKINNSKK